MDGVPPLTLSVIRVERRETRRRAIVGSFLVRFAIFLFANNGLVKTRPDNGIIITPTGAGVGSGGGQARVFS